MELLPSTLPQFEGKVPFLVLKDMRLPPIRSQKAYIKTKLPTARKRNPHFSHTQAASCGEKPC